MPLKPMLAKDADLSKLKFPLVVQPKLDGIRATVQDGVVLSRTLKLIPNAEVQDVLGRPEFEGLDGELIVGSPTATDCYRQTTSFVMSESKRDADWCFVVFDTIESGLTALPYSQRRDRLHSLATLWHVVEPNRVALCAELTAHSVEELEAIESEIVAQGHEGAIARVPSAAYKHGRSTPSGPLLKIKRFSDSEAVILDTVEEQHNGNVGFTNELGRTARSTAKAGKVGKDTLGKLVVSDLYSDVVFSIGTGFTAQERADMWADRDNLPGRIIKYKHFPVGAKDKPRHPVWLGWRDAIDFGE